MFDLIISFIRYKTKAHVRARIRGQDTLGIGWALWQRQPQYWRWGFFFYDLAEQERSIKIISASARAIHQRSLGHCGKDRYSTGVVSSIFSIMKNSKSKCRSKIKRQRKSKSCLLGISPEIRGGERRVAQKKKMHEQGAQCLWASACLAFLKIFVAASGALLGRKKCSMCFANMLYPLRNLLALPRQWQMFFKMYYGWKFDICCSLATSQDWHFITPGAHDHSDASHLGAHEH